MENVELVSRHAEPAMITIANPRSEGQFLGWSIFKPLQALG
jgi:hypothetical protein